MVLLEMEELHLEEEGEYLEVKEELHLEELKLVRYS